MHGFIRGLSQVGVRSGDPQARLIADPAVRENPAAFADECRVRGPVIRCRAVLLTFDHAVAHELLRSDDFSVTEQGGNLPRLLRWLARKTDPGLLHPLRPPSLLSVEPPDHTRYRKLVSSVFTPRAVATLRERVEETATALLDQLEDDTEVVDIVGRYCSQLPIAIIGDILGVPDEDRSRILHFGEMGAPSLDIGVSWRQFQEVNEGIVGFNAWLAEHMQRLRRDPGDDLMSQIIKASDDGPRLNSDELQALAGLVLAAGFETTVNLLGNGIRLLLDAPQHLETLAARPELWPSAVEEILRLDPPVQMTARVACKDVDLAGTPVRRDETVIIHVAGANRDPNVFTDPHRFDIERENAGRHLAFSGGRHFCLGAALARAEGEVGLRAFFERFPHARLAGAGGRRDTRVLRGWSSLPITLGTARAMSSSAGA
ncbi:cytochrome [Mycobacteriaceae bacterium 1482268.1]|nr:cytochrome [Mycobacteriaceae bacterium 1482268.1]